MASLFAPARRMPAFSSFVNERNCSSSLRVVMRCLSCHAEFSQRSEGMPDQGPLAYDKNCFFPIVLMVMSDAS